MIPESEEREASQFAMELLMPEDFLRKDIADMKGTSMDEGIKSLARRYKVEPTILTLRLGQLGLLPMPLRSLKES